MIKALHFHDRELAEELLQVEISRMTDISVEAAETLLLVHDLPHPVFGLSDLEEKIGFDALISSEKTVWMVKHYNYLMSLEGLSRFDWDEPTDRLNGMCAALRETGCLNHAARMEAYMALYGADGPPPTVSERSEVVEQAGEEWNASIERIYQQYDNLENAELRALRFELDHSDQFRKRSEIRELTAK